MSKINIQHWQTFKIGDLFEIRPTKAYKESNNLLMDLDGKNEVIVNSSYKNGVGGYTNKPTTEMGNNVTFSDTTSANSIFYHENKYVGYSHVQGLYPIGEYKDKWSKYSYLFFITIFREKAIDLNYDYVNKFTRNNAKEINIKLPINKNHDIDFNYMENYMKEKENYASNMLKKLISIEFNGKKCNYNHWKRFHLYDLFEIEAGTKLDKVAMKYENPKINFVGRSGINNGITTKVDYIDGIVPYQPGNLTLALGGAYLGSCFVQEDLFYTSQNVIVLIPKTEMSFNTKQFICSMIFKEGNTNYKAFIDELNRHIKTDFSILLPVDENDNLNIIYMDTFIEHIKNKVEGKITKLKF